MADALDRAEVNPAEGPAGGPVERSLVRLEGCLYAHPGVRDVVALEKRGGAGRSFLVAYVVPKGGVTLDSLQECARRAGAPLPDAIVRVSNLPLREDGEVDDAALLRLPVVDRPMLSALENAVRAATGVADVNAVAEWPVVQDRELPIDLLMPADAPRGTTETAPRASAARATSSSPSLSIGAPIVWDGTVPRNLGTVLARAAREFSTTTVTSIDHGGRRVFTYAELLGRAERIMAGLRASGLSPGQAVLFQMEDNADFLSAFWACALGGFVPAPLAVPATSDAANPAAVKLANAWQLFERAPILTSAALETRLRGVCAAWSAPAALLVVERLLESPSGEPWHESAPDDAALYLLTSGSTGVPKAVTQTHGALLSAARAMAQRNAFTTNDVCLNWISLEHVGGIVMCHLMFVALGARQVQVRTDYILQDILRWLELISEHRATFTWAPNFAFALVNDRSEEVAQKQWDLSTMGFIVNGGEAVVARTARRFLRLLAPLGLPGTAMRPAWGMSETSSAAAFSDAFQLDTTSDADEVVPVGPPDPGFEIRIVDDRGGVVPEGAEGRLEVRGPNVTRGYLSNPTANAESFTADGWFRTGDLGTVRDGRLTITGREKGVIIINGVNYYAHEIEAAVEEVEGTTASFTAAFAVRDSAGETDALVVALHTGIEDDATLAELLGRLRTAVRERIGIAPRHLLLVRKEDIPKTDIGKIQRPALTKRFESGAFAAELARVRRLSEEAETVPSWFFRPVWRPRARTLHQPVGAGTTLVIAEGASDVGAALGDAAARSSARAIRVRRDDGAALRDALSAAPTGERLVVLLPSFDAAEASGGEIAALALAACSRVVELAGTLSGLPPRAVATEIVSYGVRANPSDRSDIASAAGSSVAAMLKSVAAEHAGVRVRHVELAGDARAVADLLFAEMADRSDEPEVRYVGATRFVRRLVKAPPALGTAVVEKPTATRGFVLVTGGLGGIGVEVCRYLLRASAEPLLLVGRRSLEDGSDAQRASFAELGELGVVHYEAADVADEDALARAVDAGRKRWDRELGGVVHLAGVFDPRVLAAETSATLADAFRAKVAGAWNLHRLLLSRPDATFVGFSSVNGFMGGYAAGAYSAANAFLDGLVEHRVETLGRRAYSLAWSLWDGVGMSREYAFEEAARRRGYRAVTLRRGLASMAGLLRDAPGVVLIGLDGGHPEIRRHTASGVVAEEPCAYYVAGESAVVTVPASTDAFGTTVAPRIQRVDDASVRGRGNGASGGGAAPSNAAWGNALERDIAECWREALDHRAIGPDDNFFDAGGTSLKAATACRLLEQKLGRAVTINDLYRFPTIRLLGKHYGGADTTDGASLDDSEGRGEARRAARQRRRRPS